MYLIVEISGQILPMKLSSFVDHPSSIGAPQFMKHQGLYLGVGGTLKADGMTSLDTTQRYES